MKAYFKWLECRPNQLQYQQTSVVVIPEDFVVAVDVPDMAEYLVNFLDVNVAITTGQTVPKPVFTPAAIAYCLDALGRVFVEVKPDDFKATDEDDDEWDEEPIKEKSTKASDGDDWEDVIDTDDKDEKWDENTENWEEE